MTVLRLVTPLRSLGIFISKRQLVCPIDSSWHRGRHHLAIRHLPALMIGHMRTDQQILNHEAGQGHQRLLHTDW
jgi:hypothetical protein